MKNFELVEEVLETINIKENGSLIDDSSLYDGIFKKTEELLLMNSRLKFEDLVENLKSSSRISVYHQLLDKELFNEITNLLVANIDIEDDDSEDDVEIFKAVVKEKLVFMSSRGAARTSVGAIIDAWNKTKKS